MTPNCMSEGVVTMATEEETMTEAGNDPREWVTRMLAPGHAVILDCETCDLDSSILELAVIDAATGAVLLDTLVDPGDVQIHPAAAAVHGISAAQLIGAPDWPTVFPALAAVTADRVVLAYNAFIRQVSCRTTVCRIAKAVDTRFRSRDQPCSWTAVWRRC
ncbi:3'-5' exonuclease [Rhodococcus sp. ACS1]|uniref:3'-5' exonuclease n=1 Tax=Rhodococcus sp. ACS1 TaxID=2028570 RepID=UPI00269505D2|nr:3'-5' exonuclease [Rhodococcus sp. ACS1]